MYELELWNRNFIGWCRHHQVTASLTQKCLGLTSTHPAAYFAGRGFQINVFNLDNVLLGSSVRAVMMRMPDHAMLCGNGAGQIVVLTDPNR